MYPELKNHIRQGRRHGSTRSARLSRRDSSHDNNKDDEKDLAQCKAVEEADFIITVNVFWYPNDYDSDAMMLCYAKFLIDRSRKYMDEDSVDDTSAKYPYFASMRDYWMRKDVDQMIDREKAYL